jgi:hypothetical protein
MVTLNKATLRDHLAMANRHLAMANRHIAAGNRVVTRQRQLITELEADGHDTREALGLLARFEDLLALHLSDRDRLIDEIRSAEA